MARLLELPNELIQEIIRFVLSTPRLTPIDGWRYRTPCDYVAVRNIVCKPSAEAPAPDALSLLLVSQKMYSQTKHYLSVTPAVARLDLAYVDVHWIWPTWRNLPPRSRGIDQLRVTMIPCCSREDRHLQTAELMPYNGDRSLDLLQSDMDMLLSGFVLDWIGQILPKVSNTSESPFEKPRIDEVIISMDSTRYENGERLLSRDEVPLRKIDGLAHLDYNQLYPMDIWSIFEQLNRKNEIVPFGTSPFGLLREQIKNGVEVRLRIDATDS